MYHLATMHIVTDRWTDNIIMPVADHTDCSLKHKKVILFSSTLPLGHMMMAMGNVIFL